MAHDDETVVQYGLRKPLMKFAMMVTIYTSIIISLMAYLSSPRWGLSIDEPPPPPDYSKDDAWAATPTSSSGADVHPAGCNDFKFVGEKRIDTFYVHPTGYFGSANNGPIDDPLTNLLAWSTLTQHASIFNGVSNIYAPRYRQCSMHIQGTEKGWNTWMIDLSEDGDIEASSKSPLMVAMEVAFSDVWRAFQYYLEHHNRGRPFIIAAHSQGTMMSKLLIRKLLMEDGGEALLKQNLVAAYIIGNSVGETELSPLKPCKWANSTGCVLSYNTLIEGGDASHWINKNPNERLICTNPLSWEYNDTTMVDDGEASGGMPVTGHLLLTSFDERLVSARCGKDGILWVSDPALVGGWGYMNDMTFKAGGELHAIEFPMFYRDIKKNVGERVAAFFETRGEEVIISGEECSCGGACVMILLVQIVVIVLITWAFSVLLVAPFALAWAGARVRNTGELPELRELLWAFSACCCFNRCCRRKGVDVDLP